MVVDSTAIFIILTVSRYPPKMIPGCHVIIHTSAKTDYDAKILLGAVGVPFYKPTK